MKYFQAQFHPPEWVEDPPNIMDLIKPIDVISLQVARLKTLESQLQAQIKLIQEKVQILEKARGQTK